MATKKTLTIEQRIKKLQEMQARQTAIVTARKAIETAKAAYKKAREK